MAKIEIAIAARGFGPGRAQKGDIIAARKPTGIIGKREGKDFLWMTIETDLTIEELTAPEYDADEKLVSKRTKKVDVAALCAEEGISITRVEDPNDEYQPLCGKEPKPEKFKHISDKTEKVVVAKSAALRSR